MAPPTRRRSTLASTAAFVLLSVPSLLTTSVNALAPLEPADGQVYLGAWVDTTKAGNDTPALFNARIGRNTFVHQLAQTIPVTSYSDITGQGGSINETMIELTGTSAAIFMTVYPVSLYSITDDDYQKLGQQILSYQSPPANRSVFLRFAPEMQGNWMPYGVQPTQFKSVWQTMYTTIKSIAPDTAIVWSPNAAQGYPYGVTYANVSNQADQLALDTSPNGVLDSNDDAYAPYYPGDQYVDWCGLSWYWKGTTYPYVDNAVQPAGYMDGAMTGMSPPGALGTAATKWTPFYQTYCAGKNKPCAFSEMGAAYHLNNSGTGDSQIAIQTAWWQSSMTNASFMDTYEKIKLFMLFEHEKQEDMHDLRDFRISVDDGIRAAFLNDLEGVSSRYIWSNQQAIPDSAIASAHGVTATMTYTGKLSNGMPVQTKAPSVFSSADKLRGPSIVVGLMTALVGLGGWLAVAGTRL